MVEKVAEAGFEEIDDSKNVSQLVRSNTAQYWRYVKQADLNSLIRYLPFEGIVAGDPHMGNFGILPLRNLLGKRQMKYVNIDFDDAGRAPFLLDFIHLLVTSKAIGTDIKFRHVFDAYLKGLAGSEMEPPKKLKALLRMPIAEYDGMVEKYAKKRSSTEGFQFKAGKIEPYQGPIARSTIETLFDTGKVIDIAIRPVDRGGSAGELRIWVLVSSKTFHRRIMELKQYAKPATAIYQPQPDVEEWLKEVRGAFWPGLEGSEYDLVRIGGNSWFWRREKRVALIDVPYSSKKNKRTEFRDRLAKYDANKLGLAHHRQPQASAYFGAIKTDTEAFRVATKQAAIAYLKLARNVEARKGRVTD
jgi:hypothetical protein